MAALTGVAPVSRGLKGRDPELLDDKAEKENARPASPFNAIRRTARLCRTALKRSCDIRKKEHTPSSLSSDEVRWIGRPQDLHADVGLIDWAQQVKPLMEYGKSSDSFPEAAPSGHKKTHFRAEVGLDGRLQISLGVKSHHFLEDSRNRVD